MEQNNSQVFHRTPGAQDAFPKGSLPTAPAPHMTAERRGQFWTFCHVQRQNVAFSLDLGCHVCYICSFMQMVFPCLEDRLYSVDPFFISRFNILKLGLCLTKQSSRKLEDVCFAVRSSPIQHAFCWFFWRKILKRESQSSEAAASSVFLSRF